MLGDAKLLPGTVYSAATGEYVIGPWLGKGKSGDSYLALRQGEPFVLKVMHDEPVPYYAFHDHKVTLEVQAYARLRELGVPVPELLEHNLQRKFLIKSFVDGPVASQAIAGGQLRDGDVQALLALARRMRDRGHNLDWFPSNFVLADVGPVYIDYEINAYQQEWSFEDWGVWYWANTEGMRAYLDTRDILHLNAELDSGKPRQNEPASARRVHWLETSLEQQNLNSG